MRPETGNTKGNNFLKKLFTTTGSVINIAVIVAAVIGFACGAYALWDTNDVITSALSERYDSYRPEPDNPGFAQLKKKNPEVCAWVSIYGTGIDYPVVQAKDNEKYLKTDAEGEYSLAGAIFMDKDNDKHFTDFNTIIYGHNMAGNAMFGDISDYKDESFFLGHLTGNLYMEPYPGGEGRDYGLKVLAFTEADAYRSGLYEPKIKETSEKVSFVSEIAASAVYKTGEERSGEEISADGTPGDSGRVIGRIGNFDIRNNDHIVMLSTCTPSVTNGRHILICLLTDEVYEDPYADIKASKNVDTVGNPTETYMYMWILMIVFIILLFVATVMAKANRANKRKRKGQKSAEGEYDETNKKI